MARSPEVSDFIVQCLTTAYGGVVSRSKVGLGTNLRGGLTLTQLHQP